MDNNYKIENSLKLIQANIRRKLFKKGSSKSSKGSSKSSKKVFIEDILTDSKTSKNANKISRFLKSKLIVDKYTLDNRIYYYNYIKHKLKDINEDDCLEKKQYIDSEGYTIRNILNLEKLISKDNFNGEIYKTSIINSLGGFPIATKVMPINNNNLTEIILMNNITDNIISKKLSKHFLIIYGSCLCKKDINEKISLISINEIANGDLASLLNNPNIISNNNLLYNLLFQTLISIATLHNSYSHIHSDCHGGNFLWHYNNEKGYYHYIFNGKDLYLKACNYNIMIYDFGLVQKINKKNSLNIIKDYCEILPTFLNERYDFDSNSDEEKYSPDLDFKFEINEIMSLLTKKFKLLKDEKKSNSPKSSSNFNIKIEIFNMLLDNVFNKIGTKIFKTELTKSMNIINRQPYYI